MELVQFESYIRQAILEVPQSVRDAIRNVAFVVEDDARAAHRAERQIRARGMLLGLYQGVPLPRRSANYSGVLPDKITLFKHSVERLAGRDPEAVRLLVRDVVQHEIAHYLGMNEKEVRAWEQRCRNRKKKP